MVLSYRHSFHAGNFADVVKHATLALLLQHFHHKPKPFYYLDTHTGSAAHRLRTDAMAQKNREFENGVARVWTRRDYPREMEPYLSCVRALNQFHPSMNSGLSGSSVVPSSSSISYATASTPESAAEQQRRREFAWNHLLHESHFTPSPSQPFPSFSSHLPSTAFDAHTLDLYPGSSLIAAYFQRQTGLRMPGHTELEPIADRAVLCELHKTEFQHLKDFYQLDDVNAAAVSSTSLTSSATATATSPPHILSQSTRDRFHVMNHSGFKALTSPNSNIFLAPAQGRGLVLIDPPYETEHEAEELLRALPVAYNRFRQGCFAIWYPLIDYSPNSPKKLDVARWKEQLRAMNIPKMLCVEFDLSDSIREKKRGISKAQHEQQQRQLPLLDTESGFVHHEASSEFNENRQRGLGMVGTGLIVINPYHNFDSHVSNILQYLSTVLPMETSDKRPGEKASFSIEWLQGEKTTAEGKAAKAKQVLPPVLKGRAKQKAMQEAAAAGNLIVNSK